MVGRAPDIPKKEQRAPSKDLQLGGNVSERLFASNLLKYTSTMAPLRTLAALTLAATSVSAFAPASPAVSR